MLGEQIVEQAGKVQKTLGEAEKYAISQSSAGMTMGIRKSELLSQAQKQVTMMQPLLKAFLQKMESFNPDVNIRGNLSVVYEFGNGIYTSYVVGNTMSVVDIERIRTAKGNVMLLRGQIQDILTVFVSEKESNIHKITYLEEKIESMIIEA